MSAQPDVYWVILHIDGRCYGPFPPEHRDVKRMRNLKGVKLEYVPRPEVPNGK